MISWKSLVRIFLVCTLICGIAVAVRSDSKSAAPIRHIILICVDGCRADHLGLYGYARKTSPVMDRLASEGVWFEHSYSQGNESLLSHASIFSSLYPGEIAPLDYMKFGLSKQATLAKLLQAYGYRTGAFTGGGHVRKEFGFDIGFEKFYETPFFGTFFNSVPPALQWIQDNKDQPTFTFLHSYDTGRPYTTIPPFMHLYDPTYKGTYCSDERTRNLNADFLDTCYDGNYYPDVKVQKQWTWTGLRPTDSKTYIDLAANFEHYQGVPLSAADINHIASHYDGCITMADTWLGMFFDRIREMGWDESNTLIVVMADHGEDLMNHGWFNHRTSMHTSNIHVPLIFWGAGVDPQLRGKHYSILTENADIMPTILNMAGIDVPRDLRGKSLLPLLRAADGGGVPAVPPDLQGREAYTEGILGMCSVITEHYQLMVKGAASSTPAMIDLLKNLDHHRGAYEFYDVQKDPDEKNDLADDPQYHKQLVEMTQRLLALEKQSSTARPAHDPARATSTSAPAH